MFRSIKARLRQLWEQCDLFEPPPARVMEVQEQRRPPRRRPDPKGPSTRRRSAPGRPKVARTHPQDERFVAHLTEAYARYNAELFGGELHPVMIRISRRMKNRLGHYMAATVSGLPAEIAISRRHIRRDPWDDVLHTLVHEMVHQWQDESGLPIDHGQHFRRKARQLGISARATRRVA